MINNYQNKCYIYYNYYNVHDSKNFETSTRDVRK